MLSGDNLCSLIHSTVYQLKSNPIKYSYKYGWCSRLLNVAHLIGKVMISYCGDSWVMVTPGEGSSVLRLASWGGRSGWERNTVLVTPHTRARILYLATLHSSHYIPIIFSTFSEVWAEYLVIVLVKLAKLSNWAQLMNILQLHWRATLWPSPV